jgi:hypothetical protein
MSTPYGDERAVSLDEASRQLEQAVHDAQVAFDCIALGNLDRAHISTITARAAVDAAETVLRTAISGDALGGGPGGDPFGGRADAFGGASLGRDAVGRDALGGEAAGRDALGGDALGGDALGGEAFGADGAFETR